MTGSRHLTEEAHGAKIRLRLKRYLSVRYLSDRPKSPVLIHGDQHGADRIAAGIAQRWHLTDPHDHPGVEVLAFPADWSRGTVGGPERNLRMLRESRPTAVLAFHIEPGLGSGTLHMVRIAHAAGLPVEIHLLQPAK